MKIIKILSLICFLAITTLAQTGATVSGQLQIDGKVYPNTETKLILRNSVSPSATYSTKTDDNGNYVFENVADGDYQITFVNFSGRYAVSKSLFREKR